MLCKDEWIANAPLFSTSTGALLPHIICDFFTVHRQQIYEIYEFTKNFSWGVLGLVNP